MKTVKGWWLCKERKLPYGDNRPVTLSESHHIDGRIIPCKNGLHLSPKILDALKYAGGSIVYRVEGYGVIKPHGNPVDKYACSDRKYIMGGIDVENVLRKFSRMCALDVIHLWNAPNIVIDYLKTGKEEIGAAARAAAKDAAWDAAREKQNKRLYQMVMRKINENKTKTQP